ncbi:MAG: hypothetical protein ABI742_12410 [Gemmatimonadota bacterium]
MRRLSLLIAAVTLAACGGSTSETQSASPYKISVISNTNSGGNGVTPYVTALTLGVVDTGSTTPHQGVGVTLQVEVGQITSPLPNITDANGLTNVTWSIDTNFQHAGSVYALAYCAVPPGKTFCKTNLAGAQSITVSF